MVPMGSAVRFMPVVPFLAGFVLAALVPVDREPSADISRHLVHGSPILDDRDSIVVAPDGVVHRLFVDVDERLHHSWLEGRRWRDEVLDERRSGLQHTSVDVDSSGRIHAMYVVAVGGAPESPVWGVVHGVLDGTGWTVSEISPGADFGTLVMGPDDLPRVLFHTDFAGDYGNLKYGTFDGNQWAITETGLRGLAGPMALDAQGHAHAIVHRDWYEEFYASDASGSWVEVPLPHDLRIASIRVDSSGHPHIVGTPYQSGPWDSLRHTWHDGIEWHSEEILESSDTERVRDDPVLMEDGDGRLLVLFSEYDLFGPGRTLRRVAFQNGSGWEVLNLPGNPIWQRFASAAMGTDGSVHAVIKSMIPSREEYFRVAVPDLRPGMEELTVDGVEGGVRVSGTLAVENLGAGRARTVGVRFYLSTDDRLDEFDSPVGGSTRVHALRPGARAEVHVDLRIPGPVAGKRLLAVVDSAARLHDLDRPNNTAAIPLGE